FGQLESAAVSQDKALAGHVVGLDLAGGVMDGGEGDGTGCKDHRCCGGNNEFAHGILSWMLPGLFASDRHRHRPSRRVGSRSVNRRRPRPATKNTLVISTGY